MKQSLFKGWQNFESCGNEIAAIPSATRLGPLPVLGRGTQSANGYRYDKTTTGIM